MTGKTRKTGKQAASQGDASAAHRLLKSAELLRKTALGLVVDSQHFDGARQTQRLSAKIDGDVWHLKPLKVLLVDDSPDLPKIIERFLSRLIGSDRRLQFRYCNPSSAHEALDRIRAEHKASPLDLLLIDYQLQGELTGEAVLDSLNRLNEPGDLPLRYVPRAAITESDDPDQTLADRMLALGADAIFFEKAQGYKHDRNSTSEQPNGDASQLEAQMPVVRFLHSLLDTEFKEMRARAWGRVWRDTRNRVEEEIARQRDSACTTQAQLAYLVSSCWNLISSNLTESGYAARANLRLFVGHSLQSIEPVAIELTANNLANIEWDLLSYVKDWLVQARQDIVSGQPSDWKKYCVAKLAKANILPANHTISHKQADAFYKLLEGDAVMGMPLVTRHGPIGLFTLVRTPGSPAFGQTDWDQMRTLGLRLAAHFQDLVGRIRDHALSEGLVQLHRKLQEAQTEAELLRRALAHAHETIFTDTLGLHGAARLPPLEGIDREGRATLRWLAPAGGYPGWGRGKGVDDETLSKLEVEQVWTVANVIATGQSGFYADVVRDYPTYKQPNGNCNRSLMQLPIVASGLCIAVISVGHSLPTYFGRDAEQSADYRHLHEIASLIGEVVQVKRAARFQRGLLDVMLRVGMDNHDAVLTRFVNVLHGYSRGCKVMLWLEPTMPTAPRSPATAAWLVKHCWQASDSNQDHSAAFAGSLEAQAQPTIDKWNQLVTKHWEKTAIARSIFAADTPLDYTETEFVPDTDMGVLTLAQANLRIAEAQQKPQALLVMLFIVPKAFKPAEQMATFGLFSHFCARYLSDYERLTDDQERLANYVNRAQLADEARQLADSYHALRHGLRTQLWEIGETVNGYLAQSKDRPTDKLALGAKIDRLLGGAAFELDASRLLDRPVNADAKVDLAALTTPLIERMARRLEYWNVKLNAGLPGITVAGDADHLRIVLNTLVDNAIDEFERLPALQPRHVDVFYDPVCRWQDQVLPCIVVADSGPGVSADVRDRLFERGVSNKPGSSGFALSFARTLAQRAGWDLVYVPDTLSGARFLILNVVCEPSPSDQT